MISHDKIFVKMWIHFNRTLSENTRIQWIFVILFSLFVIKFFWGVHAHLSKCWRRTWSEKSWEPLP